MENDSINRKMRRSDRQVSSDEAFHILQEAKYAVLSTIGEDGYPYGVAVSFAATDDAIYIHSARTGQKLDNIAFSDKVSVTAVKSTDIIPSQFTTNFESSVAFGTARIIEGDEKIMALRLLVEKYSPGFKDPGERYIESDQHKTAMIKVTIEKLTGKVRI